MHPYGSIDTTAAWKKLRFILSVRSYFHTIDSLSIAVHAFFNRVSMSFSVDETLLQAETLLHSLERAAAGIGLHVNAHKTEYMCYNQTGDISTLDGNSLKLVEKIFYIINVYLSLKDKLNENLPDSHGILRGCIISSYTQRSVTYEVHTISFQFTDFFRMGTFIDSTHMLL